MRIALCLVSLFVFAIAFCTLGNAQTVIYVSNQGNDTEACGSVESPCQTIQYSINKSNFSTINLATENYTISEALQIDSRNITITSTNSSATIINAANGFLVASNAVLNIEHITVYTDKFGIQVSSSNLNTNRVYFSGNSFSENAISANASSVTLTNTYFNKGSLVLQTSLLDLLDTDFFANNVICQDVLSTGSSPFINVVGGKFNFTFFFANNISNNNNPLLRLVNVSNVGLSTFQSIYVNNINRLIEATDSNLNIDSASFWFVTDASKPLFFLSYTNKQVENQAILGVSVFTSSVPAFDQDLFTSNNINLVLNKASFYAFSQSPLLFDDAPLKLTIRSSTFNANTAPVFSIVASNKTQTSPAYVTFDQCWFTGNNVEKGVAVTLESVSTPVILTFSNNNPQKNNGSILYISNTNASVTSVNNYLINTTTTTNGAFVYLSNINSFSDESTTFLQSTATNGSIYYLNNVTSVVTINKSYFTYSVATSHGGVGYFSNARVQIRGSTPNHCQAMYGGIFYLAQGANVDYSSFLVSGNATKGGAVYVANGASFNISNGQVYNNNASYGGAFYLEQGSSLYSNNSLISNNIANVSGGCFYVEQSSSLTLHYGYLQESIAAIDGGAIWSQGSIRATNVAFSYNTAGRRGGSIYSDRLNVTTTRNDSVFDSFFQKGKAQDGLDLYLSYTYLRYGGLTFYDTNNSIICDHSTLYTTPLFAASRLTVTCRDCVTIGASLCESFSKKYLWYIVGGAVGLPVVILLTILIIVCVKRSATRESGYQTIQTDNYQTY